METNAAISLGDKLYIAEVPRGTADKRHHFAGEVTGITQDIVRLSGYSFEYVAGPGNFVRKPWKSERVIRLDNNLVCYVLPNDCQLDSLQHERKDTELIISDGSSFTLADPHYSGR